MRVPPLRERAEDIPLLVEYFVEKFLSSGRILQAPLFELDRALVNARAPVTTLEEAERAHIVDALQRSNWLVGGAKGAGVRLGLKRTTLKLRRSIYDFRPLGWIFPGREAGASATPSKTPARPFKRIQEQNKSVWQRPTWIVASTLSSADLL